MEASTATGPDGHTSVDERAARGKALRAEAPRSSHGEWEPSGDRADPVALLEEQAATRVAELVPIRYGRMSVSPFAFYRGAAVVMARDLAATPTSGLQVQLCGDAHVANFGGFASPERAMVFDLNDFDETLPGPWEWDLKRLVASIEINARERGLARKERRSLVQVAVRVYRDAVRGFATMGNLEVWYARLNEETLTAALRAQAQARQARALLKQTARARRKDSSRAFEKLARADGGSPRIASDPPLLVPIEELMPASEAGSFEAALRELIDAYTSTLQGDRRRLLERYSYAHIARKVVGVGSVGTRCWVVLLIGRDSGDPLFLQCKEAQRSVLEPHAGTSEFANQGQRVVEGQRLMQAASDIFLGWLHNDRTIDGTPHDFYIRQLWDWKLSADLERMEPAGMLAYSRFCGFTLARAHARSGDAVAIGAYVGGGEQLDRALADFAEAYANQNERDHAALAEAIASGRLSAVTGA